MNQPQTGEFCWNELAVADKEAAKSFYGQLLGWTFTDHDMGEYTYTMIKNRDQEFGGLWQIPNDRQEEIPRTGWGIFWWMIWKKPWLRQKNSVHRSSCPLPRQVRWVVLLSLRILPALTSRSGNRERNKVE